MNKKNLYNNDLIKYYFFLSLLIIFSIFSSFQQAQYYYDGLHWGDRVANAKDLLNGRLPYKDFFINYGLITVIIHAIFLKLFDSVIFLYLSAEISYCIAIIIISNLIKKYLNINYCYIFFLTIFFSAPFASYPWHTYYLYLFITISLYFYQSSKSYNLFFFGFFLQLAQLSSETFRYPLLAIVLFSILLSFLKNRKKFKIFLKESFLIITGCSIPFLLFLLYLYEFNLTYYWLEHQNLADIWKEFYNSTTVFLLFIFLKSFFNFSLFPYQIYNFIFNISSIIIIIFFLKKKNFLFCFISFFSLILNYLLIPLNENFRFFCGPILGIIPFFFLIKKIQSSFYKNLILFIYIFTLPLNMPFQKNQVNLLHIGGYTKDKINNDSKLYPIREEIRIFKYMKFKKETNQHFNKLLDIVKNIKSNCVEINYFANLTTDGYYHAIISNYFLSIQFIPGYSVSNTYIKVLYNLIVQKLDESFYLRVNSEIEKNNIIIISDMNINNDINIQNKKLIFKDYVEYKLPISYNNKDKYIFLPNRCYIKIK